MSSVIVCDLCNRSRISCTHRGCRRKKVNEGVGYILPQTTLPVQKTESATGSFGGWWWRRGSGTCTITVKEWRVFLWPFYILFFLFIQAIQSLDYRNPRTLKAASMAEHLQHLDFYVMPIMNVDGYEYTWTNVSANFSEVLYHFVQRFGASKNERLVYNYQVLPVLHSRTACEYCVSV